MNPLRKLRCKILGTPRVRKLYDDTTLPHERLNKKTVSNIFVYRCRPNGSLFQLFYWKGALWGRLDCTSGTPLSVTRVCAIPNGQKYRCPI